MPIVERGNQPGRNPCEYGPGDQADEKSGPIQGPAHHFAELGMHHVAGHTHHAAGQGEDKGATDNPDNGEGQRSGNGYFCCIYCRTCFNISIFNVSYCIGICIDRFST